MSNLIYFIMMRKTLTVCKQKKYVACLPKDSWQMRIFSWFAYRALKRHVKYASFDNSVQDDLVNLAAAGWSKAKELLLLQTELHGICESSQKNLSNLLATPAEELAKELLLLLAKRGSKDA